MQAAVEQVRIKVRRDRPRQAIRRVLHRYSPLQAATAAAATASMTMSPSTQVHEYRVSISDLGMPSRQTSIQSPTDTAYFPSMTLRQPPDGRYIIIQSPSFSK